MKKQGESIRMNVEFKHKCKRCGETKFVKFFNIKRNLCNLCVSKEDATINPRLTEMRRKREYDRDMKECDYSLGAIEL